MFRRFLIASFAFMQLNSWAQNNSPYSYQGIGERFALANPAYTGLGNQTVSQHNSSILNSNNAASYSFLKHQYPIFSIGLSDRLSVYNQDETKEVGNMLGISEIAFGLSFYKLFGLSVGLKPMYKKSYDFVQYEPLMSDSIRYNYKGKGLLNKAYFGFSVKALNLENVKWSLGANVAGVFGNLSDVRTGAVVKTTTNEGGGDVRSRQMSSFQYELGTILTVKLPKGNGLTFGATYEPFQKLKTVYNRQLFFSPTNIENENTWLVLKETGDSKGKIAMGQSYQAGITYAKNVAIAKKDGTVRNSQFSLSVSYAGADWSKYREDYADTAIAFNFKNTSSLNVGVEYTPETVYIGNAIPKFFDRASYRVGFYSNSLPYVFNGTQVKEWATTFGFGFPILVDRRLDSSIQLGFATGKRSVNQIGALNETFVTFNIGFSIAPSFNDRWFIKRKLD
jgi:hypothetical protein